MMNSGGAHVGLGPLALSSPPMSHELDFPVSRLDVQSLCPPWRSLLRTFGDRHGSFCSRPAVAWLPVGPRAPRVPLNAAGSCVACLCLDSAWRFLREARPPLLLLCGMICQHHGGPVYLIFVTRGIRVGLGNEKISQCYLGSHQSQPKPGELAHLLPRYGSTGCQRPWPWAQPCFDLLRDLGQVSCPSGPRFPHLSTWHRNTFQRV